MFTNVSAFTEIACFDICVDETSYPFTGLYVIVFGITRHVRNNPFLRKGGRPTDVTDFHTGRPRFVLTATIIIPWGKYWPDRGQMNSVSWWM